MSNTPRKTTATRKPASKKTESAKPDVSVGLSVDVQKIMANYRNRLDVATYENVVLQSMNETLQEKVASLEERLEQGE